MDVAGVRLQPGHLVIWAECRLPGLRAGELCVVGTPEGERVGRIVVAPDQLAGEATPAEGYSVLERTSEERALALEPAASIARAAASAVDGLGGVEVDVEPDSSRLTFRLRDPALREEVERRASPLGVPFATRDERGLVPDPPLPEPGQELDVDGERVVVERVSAFRREVGIRRPDGSLAVLPLSAAQDAMIDQR